MDLVDHSPELVLAAARLCRDASQEGAQAASSLPGSEEVVTALRTAADSCAGLLDAKSLDHRSSDRLRRHWCARSEQHSSSRRWSEDGAIDTHHFTGPAADHVAVADTHHFTGADTNQLPATHDVPLADTNHLAATHDPNGQRRLSNR